MQARDLLNAVLPEGVPVPARWLRTVGLSSAAVTRGSRTGILQPVGGQAYLRPGPELTWAATLYGAQQTGTAVHLGHVSALALQGLAHYLPMDGAAGQHVYLPGRRPATWLGEVGARFAWRWHHEQVIVEVQEPGAGPVLSDNLRVPSPAVPAARRAGVEPVRVDGWTIHVSSPERAAIELAAGLTRGESWDTAYETFGGLTSLRPARVRGLLEACASHVTRRVFVHLARETGQPWLAYTDWETLDLGQGKRQVVVGGRLDPELGITVPRGREEAYSGF